MLFPRKPSPSEFVEDAKSVIVLGLMFGREITDTVAKPWLAEVHRRGAEDAALSSRDSHLPPAGAEIYYMSPESAMLTHEVCMIAYKLARKLHH